MMPLLGQMLLLGILCASAMGVPSRSSEKTLLHEEAEQVPAESRRDEHYLVADAAPEAASGRFMSVARLMAHDVRDG